MLTERSKAKPAVINANNSVVAASVFIVFSPLNYRKSFSLLLETSLIGVDRTHLATEVTFG